MKKLIALSLAMLFLGVGIASATDFSVTGSYYVRGTIEKNIADLTDGYGYGYYDHELSIDPTWKIDDNTMVVTRFEMRDANWGTTNSVAEGTTGANTLELDDNIILEHVWGQYKFANGLTTRVGLMAAGAWGTDFANTSGDAYRLFFSMPTSVATVIAILEKSETGADAPEQGSPTIGEDEDNDTYILGFVTKLGDVNFKPLFVFVDNKSRTETSDLQVWATSLSFDGTFGTFGFEAEFGAKKYDWESEANVADFNIYGLYANVWNQMNALKLGAFGSWCSWDDDAHKGYDQGDDFYPGNILILGDDVFEGASIGNNIPGAANIGAGILLGIYGSYAVNDQLTLGAVAAWTNLERDDSSAALAKWDDATIYEISVSAAYKITANLVYDAGVGMAGVDYGDNTDDPDMCYEAFHRLSFSF